MTFGQLEDMVLTMVRPGGSKSPIVANNVGLWTNEFVLRPLYKLRRWWFLRQSQTFTLTANTSTYTFQNGAVALYVTAATLGTYPLLLPPISQAVAFWPGTGAPDALALLPLFGNLQTSSPVTQFQVFPTPDAMAIYQPVVEFTAAFAPLESPSDHNFLTDEFPMLVQSGMMAMSYLALHEDQNFGQWWQIYKQQVHLLASYDHEVRRGGTMPEPMEPFVPQYTTMTPPTARAEQATA